MKIIEIKPTKKFGGAWCAFEAPGVSPCYRGRTANSRASTMRGIAGLAGPQGGEIRVYDDAGEKPRRGNHSPRPPRFRRLIDFLVCVLVTPAGLAIDRWAARF